MKPSFDGVTLFVDLPIGAVFQLASLKSDVLYVKTGPRKFRTLVKAGKWTNYLVGLIGSPISSVRTPVNHHPEYE